MNSLLSGLIIALSFVVSVQATAQETSRPNVIVILADDMRSGATGYEGHPLIKTPHIDNMAARGTIFSNAFATSAVCTPSRTSLLTGLYERRHGINFNSRSSMTQSAFDQTYPMLLKEAGYFVGYVGKNHTPIGKNEAGVMGYGSGVMDTSFDYWYAGHRHLGFYPKDKKQHAIFKNAQADTQVEIIEEGIENFMEPNTAFQAGYSFLDSRPKDKPFALLINFNVPHAAGTSSMQQRDSDLDLYKTAYRDQFDKLELPPTYVAEQELKEPKLPLSVHSGKFIGSYDYVKTPDDLKERLIREMQTISGIDKLLGKLQAHLKQQGVADNTIIVFTSDHGLMHGEFGLGGKVFLYEPSVRIPLIVFDPRTENSVKASKSSELVALVDIAPTLLDLSGVPVPSSMQGKSLRPLMQGLPTEWRQEIFLENMMTIQGYPRMEGVRSHKWKYIRYFDRNNDQHYSDMIDASIKGEQAIYEELFDLENDPDEIHNLIADPAHASIVEELRQKNGVLVMQYRGSAPLNTHVTK